MKKLGQVYLTAASVTMMVMTAAWPGCAAGAQGWVHRTICGADKLGLENIANLDMLPATGATLYVIPMPIKGGTGAPARVFAILP